VEKIDIAVIEYKQLYNDRKITTSHVRSVRSETGESSCKHLRCHNTTNNNLRHRNASRFDKNFMKN